MKHFQIIIFFFFESTEIKYIFSLEKNLEFRKKRLFILKNDIVILINYIISKFGQSITILYVLHYNIKKYK